jgi:hypothetical protein
MTEFVAIYRSPSYSPMQHRANDTAILDGTVAHLTARGWRVTAVREADIEQGRLPAVPLYLNMCQGPLASERLMPLELDGAVVLNRPSSVLNCHRHRLVRQLVGSRIAFPRTVVVPSSATVATDIHLVSLGTDGRRLWVKRGDVHAERPEDVVATTRSGLAAAITAFTARGIPWVAVQEHVEGPVVKFYGVADGRFFRYYRADGDCGGSGSAGPDELDGDRLRALAFEAAALLGLEVFGGDVAFPEPDRPVLIDINDWPSFAPFRDAAADAIAGYVVDRMRERGHDRD